MRPMPTSSFERRKGKGSFLLVSAKRGEKGSRRNRVEGGVLKKAIIGGRRVVGGKGDANPRFDNRANNGVFSGKRRGKRRGNASDYYPEKGAARRPVPAFDLLDQVSGKLMAAIQQISVRREKKRRSNIRLQEKKEGCFLFSNTINTGMRETQATTERGYGGSRLAYL